MSRPGALVASSLVALVATMIAAPAFAQDEPSVEPHEWLQLGVRARFGI